MFVPNTKHLNHSTDVFDDMFIEHLFDLVEQTRNQYDETFNYAVIKLIVRPQFSYDDFSLTGPVGRA